MTALKEGDATAAQPLWERYHRRLVALARQRLTARRAADEEDVVQSAFHSFFQGISRGRFPQLNDRDNLWRLLVVITARKTCDLTARNQALRRGGGTQIVESRIATEEDDEAIRRVVGDEPSPEFAAQVAEEYQRLLERLDDELLRRIAVWKMEGWTGEEIAEKLHCSRRTVARKLDTIRLIWNNALEDRG